MNNFNSFWSHQKQHLWFGMKINSADPISALIELSQGKNVFTFTFIFQIDVNVINCRCKIKEMVEINSINRCLQHLKTVDYDRNNRCS